MEAVRLRSLAFGGNCSTANPCTKSERDDKNADPAGRDDHAEEDPLASYPVRIGHPCPDLGWNPDDLMIDTEVTGRNTAEKNGTRQQKKDSTHATHGDSCLS